MRGSLVFSMTLMAMARASQGGIIFSNFGPGMSYSQGIFFAEGVDGSGVSPANKSWAAEFMPTVSAALSDAIVPMWLITGTNQLLATLTVDNNDGPGAVLEQISLSGLSTSSSGSLVTAISSLHPVLTAGTPYWLVLSAPAADTATLWFWNPTGDNPAVPPGFPAGSNEAVSNNGAAGPWTQLPPGSIISVPGVGLVTVARTAFQIDGTVVPEPSSLVLIGGSVAIFVFVRRVWPNQRRGQR